MWNILKINNIFIVNFKKEVSLIFKLTNPLSVIVVSVWCLCVCFVDLHHFHSISIVCVPQEKITLIESDQQIYDFC